ncbi:MAG: hypothetical protein ABFS46_19375, partial [Myxococcota bacterium]
HNHYVQGDHLFQANYRGGVRVLRLGHLAAAELAEIAFFDTWPDDDAAAFSGVWSVYPYFSSGTLAASDITAGLFLLHPHLEDVPECADGIDNDWDGLVDASADPGCADASDLSEQAPSLPCDDGVDSDGDGRAGFHLDPARHDPGCRHPGWSTESPHCQDGLHNDTDGLMDFDGGLWVHGAAQTAPDPECVGLPWRKNERASRRCGLGFEVGGMALLILMARQRGRRGRRKLDSIRSRDRAASPRA